MTGGRSGFLVAAGVNLVFAQTARGQAANAPPAVVAGVPVNYDESRAGE